ncbi:hypothetical protein ACFSM5_06525 [Lacibacterium aquatile]|uniref:Peptidase S41 n=1 Tax=Lacibacterium aquatile TaxID=1168082 RepID=A0ABW5DSK4_9PROT
MRQTGNRPKRSWLRRGLKFLGLTIAALLILVVTPAYFILQPTFKSYPSTDLPAVTTQADKNRQDIAHLRHLPEVERGFSDKSRTAFILAVDEIERRAADLDKAGLAMAVAKAVALVDNGHTNVGSLAGDYGYNAVPIRLGWFQDGLFVVAASEEQRRLLGAQVLGVDGRATAALVEALRPYIGGPANLAREFVPNLLISPELLHAAGLAKSANGGAYEFRLADGNSVSVDLAAAPATQAALRGFYWPKRDLSPAALPARPSGWKHVLDGAALPAYLSQPNANYWHAYPQDGLLYVQINRVSDQSPVGLEKYLSDMLGEAAKKSLRNAIVDLRFNGGGNYVLTADFAERLPKLLPPDGKLFILTGANTFSAAISTAARLKHFAGSRTVILGEPVGDRGQFWGEGNSTFLPNSKTPIRYTTAYHDWERGCGLSDLTTCFFLNYVYDVPAGSLTPAKTITPSFADYVAGKDAVMVEVLRALGN